MIEKKKTTLLSPEPGPMSARGLQHRTGYERDEPRFELIFRKSKTRSSTRSVVRVPGYPRLAIVSVSIRSTKSRGEGGGGRSRKQLERRWRLHETAEALEEIPSSGGGIESIGKEERPSTNNRGSPPLPLFTPNWNSIFGGRAGGLAPKELKPVTLWWIIFKGKI